VNIEKQPFKKGEKMDRKMSLGLLLISFVMFLGAGELTVENKDYIRVTPKSKLSILPYQYGTIGWFLEEKPRGCVYFLFEIEAGQSNKYISLMGKEVSPEMKRIDEKNWEATAKVPGGKDDFIDVTTRIKITQFNSLEVSYSWKTDKPENIKNKGVFINYNLKDFVVPSIKVAGQEYPLPNETKTFTLTPILDSPEIVMYAGTDMEFTITFEGKCQISCFANKDKNSSLRISSLDKRNEFRYTLIPK